MDDQGRDHQPEFEIPGVQRGAEARQERSIEAKPASETASELPKESAAPQPKVDPGSLAQPAATVLPGQPATSPPTAPSTSVNKTPTVDQKQWVNKAKTVIAQTKTDPHAQVGAIGQVKADYIQANFNKQVKVSED